MRKLILVLILCCLGANIRAQHDGFRVAGDIIQIAIPAAAGVLTLAKGDFQGSKQLALSGVTAIGATYILKYATHKQRPDNSDYRSFPSGHTACAFTGATFLHRRYGWKWGVPAYVLSTYVGWSRIYAKKHDIWDVMAGAALGAGSSLIFTRPWARKHQLSLAPLVVGETPCLYASFVF